MSDGIQLLLFVSGIVLNVIGWTNAIQSKYIIPPIPVGWVFGVIFSIIGSSFVIAAIVIIVRFRKIAIYWAVGSILGGSMVFMGIRTANKHPLEFPDCPCPPNTHGNDCLPCPGNQNLTIICSGHGVCDEGSSGTGACICDYEWAGSDTCNSCRDNIEGVNCDRCSRGFDGLKCDRCYPGYTGQTCNICADGWLTEVDSLGTLCRKCQPNRYGPYCKTCPVCTQHDNLAECRDNDWHDTNVYQPNVCTATATTCTDDYDCSSFNCKGRCISGSTTDNTVCSSDDDCVFGTCQLKSCCIEERFGNGECLCQRVGYFGPFCMPCPGFDNLYSSSICSGHGTCTASYVDGSFSKLVCECSSEGEGFWDGEECGCFKTKIDGDCEKCANGFFSNTCQMCPGGSGVAQCSFHGECDDGIIGEGTCECDVDTKENGLGAWKGESCSACLTGDVYGDQCQPCPLFTLLPCDGSLPVFGNTGYCSSSCGINTCSENGECV
jgi:hypothetical protein